MSKDLLIEERKLTLRYEDTDDLLNGTSKCISDADAHAVQKALGATCYKEVYDKMKERFGKDLAGFDLFRRFLDEHSVAYEYAETM